MLTTCLVIVVGMSLLLLGLVTWNSTLRLERNSLLKERSTWRGANSVLRDRYEILGVQLRNTQLRNNECMDVRDAARDRTKHFVDMLNILANEPLSRRKREAFFREVRERGLDHATTEFENKFGRLFIKDEV